MGEATITGKDVEQVECSYIKGRGVNFYSYFKKLAFFFLKLGVSGDTVVKESACNAGDARDLGLIPGMLGP